MSTIGEARRGGTDEGSGKNKLDTGIGIANTHTTAGSLKRIKPAMS
jgi:hypothetical protein